MLGKRLEPLTFFYEGVFMVTKFGTAAKTGAQSCLGADCPPQG
jgi:hypothetical protein